MSLTGVENSDLPSTSGMLSQDFQVLDEFFQNMDWSQLDSTTSIASSTLLDDKFICQKDLGCNVYLRARIFKRCVKIHIRKFLNYKDSVLTPTSEGVCFDLTIFFRLILKIANFNLEYSHASFVVNNTLLVLKG